jgi:glycyl-tRNA synthetase beta chain
MSAQPLLVELLTEELPPKSLPRLAEAFREHLLKGLVDASFVEADADTKLFATPRRLALLVGEVLPIQPDRVIERKGPAVASGLDANGRPTRALDGFMRAAGVDFGQLERSHDGKAEYFVARVRKSGEPLDAHLAAMVEAALRKLPIPKVMRWGDSDHQFVRPVHSLVMLHGSRVVPGRVLGLESGRLTRGHRFQGAARIDIPHAAEYERRLADDGRVIASFEERRSAIARRLGEIAAAEGGRLNEGFEALLDEVTALVENPAVYVGEFEHEFLKVPQECLILTMQQNQKYFPLLDGDGRLLPRFLIVSNMAIADPAHIINGNQRVVRPRLADARFFYETDLKTRLETLVPRLGAVVYHNRLGTQLARSERLRRLAGLIARRLHADADQAQRAAWLAKADLLSGMVGEFPELQGIMGQYYARHDGEAPAVVAAIEQHYHPRFAGDSLPQGNVAAAVALADRLDALTGFFGIGQVPTGDKDPFGLRRAALGVLRILAEKMLPLDLAELMGDAAGGFAPGVLQEGHGTALHDFLLERLRGYLREAGYAHEQVDAVLAQRPTRIDLVPPRLAAVKEFVAMPEAAALAAANKRIVNILKKTRESFGETDVALLQEDAERALFRQLNDLEPQVRSLVGNEDYTGALKALAQLRAAVDSFFDSVMVMVDEPLTRANRLALLDRLARLMNQVADISRLSV